MTRVAFVTHICPHYRVRTFELLAGRYNVQYFFFSAGDDWYWLPEHGVRAGRFSHEYLPGVKLGRTRLTPTLPVKLWRGAYDVYVKSINGRFALPVTYLIARLRGKPFVLWTGVWMRVNTFAHRMLYPLTRYIYRHADAVVVYGEHVKRFLVAEGVRSDVVFIAPHAIDNSEYARQVSDAEQDALRQRLDIPAGAKVVLFIGRFEEEKGLDVLIDAFASLADTRAVLVLGGSGSLRESLEQRARDRGIADRVRFAGYIPPSDTVAFYSIAWVYVLSSVTTPVFKEPWGLVVNEAFSQGLPVVATDSVGAAAGGLVRDGVNGLVVPERDRQALATALDRVLADDALRQRMSGEALRGMAGWNNDAMVDGFAQAIESVLQSSRR
jgi:glycosyltransferase involved in cell wall biosynthesis